MSNASQKHTPGPWETSDGGKSVVGHLGFSIPGSGGEPAWVRVATVRTEDDARLIAAAPDLLDALDTIERAARSRENTMGSPIALLNAQRDLRDAAAEARAAIAKAKGGE